MLGTSALSLSLLLLLALLLRADGGSWRPCCTDDDDIVRRHRMRSSSPDLLMLRPCALPTMTACLPLLGDGDRGDIEKARTNSTGTVRGVPEEHAAGDELRQQQHAMKKRRQQQRQSATCSGARADRWIIVGSKWRIGKRMAVERSASWSIDASMHHASIVLCCPACLAFELISFTHHRIVIFVSVCRASRQQSTNFWRQARSNEELLNLSFCMALETYNIVKCNDIGSVSVIYTLNQTICIQPASRAKSSPARFKLSFLICYACLALLCHHISTTASFW